MDSLPQEIINNIALHLERFPEVPGVEIESQRDYTSSNLPPYAAISRQWKEAIEYITFNSLHIKSDELTVFESIVKGNRRNYLSRLIFTMVLPTSDWWRETHLELLDEQKFNNDHFDLYVKNLFSLLRSWEDEGFRRPLRLEIPENGVLGSGLLMPGKPRHTSREKGEQFYNDGWVFADREDPYTITLSDSFRVPKLHNVHSLEIKKSPWQLSPLIGPKLAEFLPNLSGLHCEFERDTFVHVLTKLKFNRLRKASINFPHKEQFDQRPEGSSQLEDDALYDPISAAIYTISQHLTSLSVSGFFDPTLFWPSEHETSSTPSWPCLRELEVEFNMMSPRGEWYFTGEAPPSPPPEDDPDEVFNPFEPPEGPTYSEFRTKHSEETMRPFLHAFCKALQQMPVLEHYLLTSRLAAGECWQVAYFAPGRDAGDHDEEAFFYWDDEAEEITREECRSMRRFYLSGEWELGLDVEIDEGLTSAGRQLYDTDPWFQYLSNIK